MNARARLAVAYGEELLKYDFGGDHPMRSARIAEFFKLSRKAGILDDPRVKVIKPHAATVDDLLLFHTPSYIERVRKLSDIGTGMLDEGDTPVFSGVYEAACYTVGTTLECLKDSLSHHACSFNPMGGLHHARRDRAAGFCVFNDVAIAIEYSRKQLGIRQILYIDIDAHHGDGVMYEYYNDRDLRILDFHEDGRYLYPGTGSESETGGPGAKGSKMNVRLQPGSSDEQFEARLSEAARFLAESDPELVILQAGADCLAGDPIAHLSLSPRVHSLIGGVAKKAADRSAGGSLLALGGGGYDPKNTANAWLCLLKAFLS